MKTENVQYNEKERRELTSSFHAHTHRLKKTKMNIICFYRLLYDDDDDDDDHHHHIVEISSFI